MHERVEGVVKGVHEVGVVDWRLSAWEKDMIEMEVEEDNFVEYVEWISRSGSRDQREWVFEVREVKSENKKLSLFFEKCKVKKKNVFNLFREVQSEKKMLSLFFKK